MCIQTHVKTHQSGHFKYVQLIACELYVNKAGKMTISKQERQTQPGVCWLLTGAALAVTAVLRVLWTASVASAPWSPDSCLALQAILRPVSHLFPCCTTPTHRSWPPKAPGALPPEGVCPGCSFRLDNSFPETHMPNCQNHLRSSFRHRLGRPAAVTHLKPRAALLSAPRSTPPHVTARTIHLGFHLFSSTGCIFVIVYECGLRAHSRCSINIC